MHIPPSPPSNELYLTHGETVGYNVHVSYIILLLKYYLAQRILICSKTYVIPYNTFVGDALDALWNTYLCGKELNIFYSSALIIAVPPEEKCSPIKYVILLRCVAIVPSHNIWPRSRPQDVYIHRNRPRFVRAYYCIMCACI